MAAASPCPLLGRSLEWLTKQSGIFRGAALFSPTCQYAIRALCYLARHSGDGPVLARDIAAAENVPRQFLSKILHQLGQKGLVRSQKGPGGGFALARPTSQLTLAEITVAVDGVQEISKRCILGLELCTDAAPCALHDAWKNFRTQYDATIGALTLAEMVAILQSKRDAHAELPAQWPVEQTATSQKR
jgi:Rrf2 family protein